MIWQTSKVRRGTLQYWSSRGERFWGRRLQLNALMAWRHCPIRCPNFLDRALVVFHGSFPRISNARCSQLAVY
ncbi:hypothetical protein MPTK1_8g08820 [Marchantia polymorpha subsp. ruderalis]|uniref:Uncharacterized protein n=1 Tax=Marchantia polymorpha TaxID=3197 RepID=A0A2R6WRJ8_MARPO|nr:hypothetical protein MARPO_0063s0036 [Marchantia polymorpha]BBN19223.1 hypothetical protein Mp_8g08820 [Marchantia polymorpha subsp. ruderalis]|eukprot:PTQ36488.1 hypothetical protein MARPO_0063s0036 [Marchantia polymorpha]